MSKEELAFKITPSEVNIEDLYDFITANVPFDKVIELYKLLKHKMETLEDKPRYSKSALDTTQSVQLY